MKPVRGNPILDRFQVMTTPDHTLFVAVTGMGKLKAATATAAVYTALSSEGSPLLINVGIAGAPIGYADLGSALLIHQVRDVASNLRFYPDILIRHPFAEASLDTHDAPVTSSPAEQALVDMEASGFMQAATLLAAPSEIAVIKVISDFCDGGRTTPSAAQQLITQHVAHISEHMQAMRNEVSHHPQLSANERAAIEAIVTHAHFSQTQRIEITRAAIQRKAKDLPIIEDLSSVLAEPIHTKLQRSAAFQRVLDKLREATLP
jgi:nucleoside phosphorylase